MTFFLIDRRESGKTLLTCELVLLQMAIGDILLLVNPFKPLPIYDLEVDSKYLY